MTHMEMILQRVESAGRGKTSMNILGRKAIILGQCNSSLRFQHTKLDSILIFFKEARTHHKIFLKFKL